MIEEYFLIFSQVFLMQSLDIREFIRFVQELVFSLAHLMEGKELHPLKTCIQEEGGNTLCIGKVCIEARDYGYPRQNGKTLLMCPPKISENKFIPCAGPFFVLLRVKVLYIEEQQVEKGCKSVKDLFVHTAGGLDRRVDPFLFESQDQRFREVRLHHPLAAGNRHSSAGFLIENGILHTHFSNLIYSFKFPLTCQSTAGASFYTGQATGTLIEINVDSSVSCFGDCLTVTGVYAFAAVHAIVTVVHDLHFGKLGLRVGAPSAA